MENKWEEFKNKIDERPVSGICAAYNISELRHYLNLSLAAFGKPLGYSASHIARFERNETEPSYAVVEKICDTYGVDPGYFSGTVQLSDAIKKTTKEERIRAAGERLKSGRSDKKLSMRDLSQLSDVAISRICMIENGESSLTEKTAEKLARALEVGVEWLLTGDEEKKEYPVDGKMTEWLWKHPEVREKIWNRMDLDAG